MEKKWPSIAIDQRPLTHLAKAGVAPRVAQSLMRHSKLELTMKTYTDPKLLDTVGALEALPKLRPDDRKRQEMSATGTEGNFLPSGLPESLPFSLPKWGARPVKLQSSPDSLDRNSALAPRDVTQEKSGTSGTSSHPESPHFTDESDSGRRDWHPSLPNYHRNTFSETYRVTFRIGALSSRYCLRRVYRHG